MPDDTERGIVKTHHFKRFHREPLREKACNSVFTVLMSIAWFRYLFVQVFLDDNLEDFIQVNSMTFILSIVRYLFRRSFFNQLRQSAQWDIFNIILILETT